MFVQHVGVNGGALCFSAGLLLQFMFLSEVVFKDVEDFSSAEAELLRRQNSVALNRSQVALLPLVRFGVWSVGTTSKFW